MSPTPAVNIDRPSGGPIETDRRTAAHGPSGIVAGIVCILSTLAVVPTDAWPEATKPVMGLAYQPYVGQWSASPDNPYAPGRFYTPAFNSYFAGIALEQPDAGLWKAGQTIELHFNPAGNVSKIAAQGTLTIDHTALREASPADWSQTYFKYFEGTTPQAAVAVDHRGSVYRQLAYLVEEAGGAPLTLATYGTGFDIGYWRRLGDEDFVVLPVWAENRVDFYAASALTPTTQRAIDELYFYFPPEATYVVGAPDQAIVETTGTAGHDLALVAVHLRVFEPARRGDPGAVLNPGFLAGDGNAQVSLAAAEINARAGRTVLTIKQGVPNIAVDGTLINPRMRFAIRSALAQAQIANARHPGTVTHLVISNEYAEIAAPVGEAPTPTQQVTEMVRFARDQMAPGGDFAGLGLAIGVRSHGFRGVDVESNDPATRRFTQDVRELVRITDVLMENIYPSPEAVEIAQATGRWDAFFDPDEGELSVQWRAFEASIGGLAGGKAIQLMIGEIGHPTNGIAFNLPGYVVGDGPTVSGSAFARVSEHLTDGDTRIGESGIEIFQTYFNETLSAAFLTDAFRWSRETGAQIHAFEAFDEPHKSSRNLPLAHLSLAGSTLHQAGSYGAEGFYGIFRYSGVAGFSATPELPIKPGAKLVDPLAGEPERSDLGWASQFSGRFYLKLRDFDFGGVAKAFVTETF
jgi:hypothetical protein